MLGFEFTSGQLAVLGVFGAVFSSLNVWSSVPLIRSREKANESQDELWVPYYLSYLSVLLWFAYGAFIQDYALIGGNAVSLCASTYYMDTLYTLAKKKSFMKFTKVLGNGWILFTALWVSFYDGSYDKKSDQFGLLCSILVIATYVAPIVNNVKTIRTRNARSSPFLPGVAMTVMGAIWTLYGLGADNVFIALTSATALVFGAFQVTLFLIFSTRAELRQIPKDFVAGVVGFGRNIRTVFLFVFTCKCVNTLREIQETRRASLAARRSLMGLNKVGTTPDGVTHDDSAAPAPGIIAVQPSALSSPALEPSAPAGVTDEDLEFMELPGSVA